MPESEESFLRWIKRELESLDDLPAADQSMVVNLATSGVFAPSAGGWLERTCRDGLPAVLERMRATNEFGLRALKQAVRQRYRIPDDREVFLTAGASGTFYFHYITTIGPGARGGFLSMDDSGHVKNYPPQYLAAQVISKEWVQPVDTIHKLFKVASEVKDKDGNILVTAYPLERPDGQWSVMLVNKDRDTERTVKIKFSDPDAKQDRFFSGKTQEPEESKR